MSADASVQGSQRFTHVERLELAWALGWPCSVLNVIYWLLRAPLGLSSEPGIIDLCFGFLGLFLFTPWVVRRAVKLDFLEFHLVALRGGSGDPARGINYWESLRVAWLLTWRMTMILLMLFVIIEVLWVSIHWLVTGVRPPKLLVGDTLYPSPGVSGLLRTLGEEIVSLLVLFWIVKAAVRKSYANFSFQVERTDSLATSRPVLAD